MQNLERETGVGIVRPSVTLSPALGHPLLGGIPQKWGLASQAQYGGNGSLTQPDTEPSSVTATTT